MASSADDARSLADSPPQDTSSHGIAQSISSSKIPSSSHEYPPFSSQPVEMVDLSNSREGSQPAASTSGISPMSTALRNKTSPDSSPGGNKPSDPNPSEAPSKRLEQPGSLPSPPLANIQASLSDPSTDTPALPMSPPPAHLQDMYRANTTAAIGAASDNPHSEVEPAEITSTMLMITLLLSTGARHLFKLDDKYLQKRSVTVEDDNPINLSVYTLKELIWRDWRTGEFCNSTKAIAIVDD